MERSASFITMLRIDWDALPQDSYVSHVAALRSIKEMDFEAPVTFLVGENGTGKSTLLEAIAVVCGFNAEGGTRNYRFSTYDDISDLASAMTVGRIRPISPSSYFFRAESFFNLATKAKEYVGGNDARWSSMMATLHEQSHGESFMSWMQSFDSLGLYLMDEPEAALSPQHQLSLVGQLAAMSTQGSQFIIATHSPVLLALPGADIQSFDGSVVTRIAYEQTNVFRITDLVVNHRESLMHHLIDD